MVTRAELFSNNIIATQQPPNTGCMWHSLYALTGNKEFLEYEIEGSPHRMMLKVYELGYLLWPLITLPYTFEIYDELWQNIFDHARNPQQLNPEDKELKLLLSMRIKTSDVHHTIAVEGSFISDCFRISDPAKNNVITCKWKDIINIYQKNASIYEVLVLDSGNIEDYEELRAV